MKIKSYAKINLLLDVVERLKDNYHSLNMVMLLIDLYDETEIKLNKSGEINIKCLNQVICKTEDNTVYKCLKLLIQQYNITSGFDILIKKTIPMQAGLGGGSSNAAYCLKAANKLLGLNLSLEELAKIGFQVGADIPFFIYAKPSKVLGKGEIVKPFDEVKINPYILLVKPSFGISTKEAYTNLDISNLKHFNSDKMVEGLINNDYETVVSSLYNALEDSSFQIEPRLRLLKEELIEYGFDGVLMSGSGSCFFAFSNDKTFILKAKKYFGNKNLNVFLTRIQKGV